MPEPLEAVLELDTSAAERSVEELRRELESQLQDAVDSFGEAYRSTASSLPAVEAEVDASAVTEGITTAVTSADTMVEPTLDGEQLTVGITSAVGSADATVTPTADAEEVTTGIERAVGDADATVKVEGDFSDVQSQLEAIGQVDLSGVGGGLSDADLQAQDLNDTLSDLADSGQESSDKLGNVSNVSTTMATAFSAAKGEGRQVVQSLAGMSGEFGPVIAGAGATAIAFGSLFTAGEHSVAALERLQTVLGDAAKGIEQIDVGGLTGSLGDLSIKAGVSAGQLRIAAANAAQMGISSGATKTQVVEFANNVNALALRATAMNPQLGEAGTVAERLNLVLGRGGRFLNRYGIDMTAAEITTRALADTGKNTARELTSFERSTAGASIAIEKLGNKLGTDFAKGAEQSSVRMKSLKAELSSAFATAGKPLVEPTIAAMESLTGVATELSKVLGELGQAGLPVLAAGFEVIGTLAKPLELVAELIDKIPGPLLSMGVAFLALKAAVGPLSTLVLDAALGLETLGTKAVTMGGPLLSASDRMTGLGAAIESNKGKIAAFAASALIAVQSFDQIGKSAEGSAIGIGSLITAGASAGSVFGPWGTLIGGTIGGVVGLGKAFSDTGQSAKEFADEITKLGDEIEGLGPKAAAGAFFKQIDGGISKVADAFSAVGQLGTQTRAQTNAWISEFGENYNRNIHGKIDEFRKEFEALAKSNPAAAHRVIDGLRGMGDAIPSAQIDKLEGSLLKSEDALQRHAKRTKEATDENSKFKGAVDGTVPAVDTQAKAVEAAQTKLAKYAADVKGGTDRNKEFADSIAKEITGKVPEVDKVFNDLLGAVQKFSDSDIAAPDVSGYTKALTDTADQTSRWVSTVQDLFNRGLSGLASLVLQRGPELSGALIDEIAGSGDEQRTAWNTSLVQGFQAIAQAQEQAKTEGENLAKKMAEGVKSDPNDLLDAMKTKVVRLAKFAELVQLLIQEGNFRILGVLEGMGADAAGTYVDGFLSQTPAERAAFNQQLVDTQNLEKEKQDIIDRGATAATDIIGTGAERSEAAYAQGIEPVPRDADEAMLQAQAKITARGEDLRKAGSIVGAAAEQGVIEHTQSIPSDVGGFIGVIPGVIDAQQPYAYTSGIGLGSSITQGIAHGINGDQAARDTQQAIDERLDAIAAEAYLHIQGGSPARKFMPIGESISQGIGVGIESGMKVVADDFRSALDDLTSAGGSINNEIDRTLGLDYRSPERAALKEQLYSTPAVRGAAPMPPAGASLTQVQVTLDPSQLAQMVDQSIHDITVHQYEASRDAGGQGLIRALRDYQFAR